MSTALLLTDCQDKNFRLQRKIGQILPCKVAPLHDSLVEAGRADLVVTDVALDSPVVTQMLRLALQRYRANNVPLLFLLQEINKQSVKNALELGACKILSSDSAQEVLTDAVLGLVRSISSHWRGQSGDRSILSMREYVAEAGTMFIETMEAAQSGKVITADSVSKGADCVLEAMQNHSVRSWLDVVWSYDDLTYQHCLLVAGLAAAFAIKLGFSLPDRQRLTGAALLHDIGKARISRDILNKPGRLTDDEMKVMKTHPSLGADLLRRQGGFSGELISVVRHHHEYLDGTGYPDGLHADEISDLVRMTTICDIYAALIERRAYKAPMSMNEASGILAAMGGKLDPALLKAFEIVVCDI